MREKYEKIKLILFLSIIFIFTFMFFTKIHRLVIFDADDWTYIAIKRSFLPEWGAWNPIKLFPESLMSLCGTISNYLINPFVNDYVKSFTITTSFVVSSFITVYIYMFLKLINYKYTYSINTAIELSILFYLSHFLILLVEKQDNQYLFWAHNVNCYYNYLIPNLVNFSLIFYLLSHDVNYSISFNKNNKSGLFLLLIYVCIFSNMFCNIVLVVYSGTEILIKYIYERRIVRLFDFFKKYFLLFLIVALWIVSLIFESSGGRANDLYNSDFIQNLVQCIKYIRFIICYGVNRKLLCSFIIVCIAFLIIIMKKKNRNDDNKLFYYKFIICIVMVFIYFMLLCAKAKPEYILRSEVIFPIYVFCLLLVFMLASFIIIKYNKILVIFPFIICICFFELNVNLKSLRESNTPNLNPDICEKIDNDLLNQIKGAANNGATALELHVPKFDSKDNWPLAIYLGERISETAYIHGITDKKMDIKIIVDIKKNIDFKIN